MVDVKEQGSGSGDTDSDYESNGYAQEPSWEAIFGAPDYSTLVRPPTSRIAKEYERNTNSILKAALIGTLNAGAYRDAAAILHYGPQFSAATGQLAASNDTARKVIDLATAPASPVAMFLISAIGLGSQLARNHEREIREIPGAVRQSRAERKAQRQSGAPKPPPRFTLKLGRLQIPIRFKVKLGSLLAPFRSQTKDPEMLAAIVFSNPDLITALEKQGIIITRKES
jgi:hypothetical protein